MPPRGRGSEAPPPRRGRSHWRSKNRSQNSQQRFAIRRNTASDRASTLQPSVRSASSSAAASQPSPSIVSSPSAYVQAVRSRAGRASHSTAPPPLNDTSIQGDQSEDHLCQTIMALEMKQRGTIGCCYYVAVSETLFLMQDIPLGSLEIVEQLRLLIEPTVILISSNAEDELMACLDPNTSQNRNSPDYTPVDLPYVIELRPSSDFRYEAGREKLVDLRIGAWNGPDVHYVVPGEVSSVVEANSAFDADVEQAGRDARLIKLSGWVSVDSRHSVACVNALLSYIKRKRSNIEVHSSGYTGLQFRISSVTMFSLKDTMFINPDTVLSLQLMQSESHPALHYQGPTKASSGSKEGLSVYGLFQSLARTPQGKHLLKQYFLRPSLNLSVIQERQNAIACFIRPENEDAIAKCRKSLRCVRDMRSILQQLRRGLAAGSGKSGTIALRNWAGLIKFTTHATNAVTDLSELAGHENAVICRKFMAKVPTLTLAEIGRVIDEIVDLQESEFEHRAVVKSGYDEELDERKRQYAGLEEFLRDTASQVAGAIPQDLLGELNVAYFPQIGFLVTMPRGSPTGAAVWEGSDEEPWERMFSTDVQVYYKNARMRELDEDIGDVYTDICEREIEILHELAERILQFEFVLLPASDVCGELDCLLALAEGARRYQFHRPHVKESGELRIKAGWHPLQSLTCRTSYVPNDTLLASGAETTGSQSAGTIPNVLVLTGPNYSGKSVYLKQVAVIIYLAQIGSYVPAEAATIGLADAILTRVTTRESVSSPHSAFMTDLLQMSRALRLATARSLLIVDEFGKGTAAADGAGLAAGVIEHIASLGQDTPRALIATHFHEILQPPFLTPRPTLAFAHMEVRLADDHDAAAAESDLVTFLYTLRPGKTYESLGTHCAAISGIPSDIVRRARYLAAVMAEGGSLRSSCAVISQAEEEDLRRAEATVRAFVADDLDGDPWELLDELCRPETAMLVDE